MVDKILDLPKPSKVELFSPIVRGRKGEYRKEILNFKKQGFEKIRIDGKIYDIDNAPNLNKKIKHNIELLIDKFINKKKMKKGFLKALNYH